MVEVALARVGAGSERTGLRGTRSVRRGYRGPELRRAGPQRIPPILAATTAQVPCFPMTLMGSRLSAVDRSPTQRRFFLADPEAVRPRLRPEEERHAASVVRLGAGDRILGLDGLGGLHPLVVSRSSNGRLEFERDGEIVREAPPGSAGASLGWIEVAAPLPKGARAEAMLDRLSQLGLAALRPLDCARNQGFARESAESRLSRLERTCMEACKQSRRSWLPCIHPTVRPLELRELLKESHCVLLSPGAEQTLIQWSARLDERRLSVIAGPEGGFDESELADLDFATPVMLSPHVLRIETAVEAAVSTLVQMSYARGLRTR